MKLPLGPLKKVIECAVTEPVGRCVPVGVAESPYGEPLVQHVLGATMIGISGKATYNPKICKQMKLNTPRCLNSVKIIYFP